MRRYTGGAGGKDLAELPLERVAHVPLVVVWTEWSRHWRTEAYFEANPHLTREACEELLQQGWRWWGSTP